MGVPFEQVYRCFLALRLENRIADDILVAQRTTGPSYLYSFAQG